MKKYLGILAILALVVIASGCTSSNAVNVIGTSLTVPSHSITNNDKNNLSSSVNPTVNGTIKNTGSTKLSYVPVSVKFYNSNGDLVYTGVDAVVNLAPGEEKSFGIEDYIGSSLKWTSYEDMDNDDKNALDAVWPDHYEITVGDPKTNVTPYFFAEVLQPVASSYNSSKGTDSGSIHVKGQTIDATYASSYDTGKNISLDTNATVFLVLNDGDQYVGRWVERGSGRIVSGYKPYVDVVAISWPEMKVIGWHRLYGSSPSATVTTDAYATAVYGNSPDISAWISSLSKS